MSTLLNTEQQQNTLVVTLPRDFSAMNVDKHREHLDQLAASRVETIILDFSNTEFIDSSGIGAMVFLFKKVQKRGLVLQLLNVEGQPNKLMKLLRVDMTIPFITSAQSA